MQNGFAAARAKFIGRRDGFETVGTNQGATRGGLCRVRAYRSLTRLMSAAGRQRVIGAGGGQVEHSGLQIERIGGRQSLGRTARKILLKQICSGHIQGHCLCSPIFSHCSRRGGNHGSALLIIELQPDTAFDRERQIRFRKVDIGQQGHASARLQALEEARDFTQATGGLALLLLDFKIVDQDLAGKLRMRILRHDIFARAVERIGQRGA